MRTMRKEGDRLVSTTRTAPQTGAINTTYSGWRGSILTALNELLCWDQLYAIGGALRHIEFRPALGAFTCATHPASVSTAPVQAMEISLYPAYNTLSKMLSCHRAEARRHVNRAARASSPSTAYAASTRGGDAISARPSGGHRRVLPDASPPGTGGSPYADRQCEHTRRASTYSPCTGARTRTGAREVPRR